MKLKLCRNYLVLALIVSANVYAQNPNATITTTDEPIIVRSFNTNLNPSANSGAGHYNFMTHQFDNYNSSPAISYGGEVGSVTDALNFTHPEFSYFGDLSRIKSRISPVDYSANWSNSLFQNYNPSLTHIYVNTRRTDLNFTRQIAPVKTNPNTSEDAQNFNADGIYCSIETPVFPTDLSNLDEETNVQACFNMRELAGSRGETSELIGSDQRACNCLKTKSISSGLMNQSLAANEFLSQSARDQAETRVQNIVKENLSSTLDSLFFTSAVVFNQEMDANAKAYSFSENVFKNTTVNVEGQRSLDLSYSPDFNKMFVDTFPKPRNQCLSKQEFFRMQMMPYGRDLALLKTESAGPEKWDYERLEIKYRELMDKTPREKAALVLDILKVKAKLKFLNRNPMIKYYLGSERGEQTKKTQIMNYVNASLNDQGCQEISSECTERFHQSLEALLKDDDARTIIRDEARKDIDYKARRDAAVDFISDREDLRTRNFWGRNRLDRDHMIAKFRENFGLDITPDNCHSNVDREIDGTEALKCIQMFSAYCKTVDEFSEALEEKRASYRGIDDEIRDDIKDDLDETLRNDFNPNLSENKSFNELNTIHCGNRSKSTGSLRRKKTFEDYTEDLCKDGDPNACEINSEEELIRYRQAFYASHPVARDGSVSKPLASLNTTSGVPKMGSTRFTDSTGRTREPIEEISFPESTTSSTREAENSYSTIGTTQTTQINNLQNETELDSGFNYSNYSNLNSGVSGGETQVTTTEPQRIQDMDQERREEMLQDWEQEYSTWKERYGSDKSPATVARDSELRTEISTLRALLDQQKTISDQQYQLLNDAIAARTRLEQENLQRNQERERSIAAAERRSGNSAVVSRNSDSDEISRGIASINDSQVNATSGNSGGVSNKTSSGASIGGSSSGNSASLGSSGSSDSVAREEAKLVNMRQGSDGSIIISASGNSSGAVANAITVSVSDEQYRILQTNPTGLNLSQIERNIPRDQIAQLERNGEIILLLRNGENPPYEVKVKKQDNRLVYSVVDQDGKAQSPVRRVNIRDALVNLFNR